VPLGARFPGASPSRHHRCGLGRRFIPSPPRSPWPRAQELEPPIIEDLVRFGRDRGIETGIEIGRDQGIEIGRDQGRHQEARDNLLEILELRGLTVAAEERARVESETSLEQLRVWLRRAVRAGSVSEVFGR